MRCLLQVAGVILLAASLAGWSAWWVICNIYEFAPALATTPLLLAWVLALAALVLAAVMRARLRPWLPLWLAAGNGLCVQAIHRAGIGEPLQLALLAALGLSGLALGLRRG